MIHVSLDRERCQGHGRCYATAPRVFEPDDEGYAVLVRPAVDDDLRSEVLAAVRGCPERALSVDG